MSSIWSFIRRIASRNKPPTKIVEVDPNATLTDEDREAVFEFANASYPASRYKLRETRKKALEHYRAACNRGVPIEGNWYMLYMREIDASTCDVSLLIRYRIMVVEFHRKIA